MRDDHHDDDNDDDEDDDDDDDQTETIWRSVPQSPAKPTLMITSSSALTWFLKKSNFTFFIIL